MPRLFACGASHRSTPIQRREVMAVPASEVSIEAARLASIAGGEWVVISTCNRVELYAFCEGDAFRAANEWFRARGGDAVMPALEYWSGAEAVRHLFRVTSGLDSMIVGESEIQGQVKTGYLAARTAGTASRAMNLLFQAALACGKRVRAHTSLSSGISSTGGAAAAMAARVFGDLTGRRVLVLGAGKMAESCARHLIERGAAAITVANRNVENAADLARRLGGCAASLEEGLARLADFDVVIASTSSPEPLLRRGAAAAALRERGGRSIFIVDVAVPRNIEPEVGELDGVLLYDIDSLEAIVRESLVRRRSAVEAAELEAEERARDFAASRGRDLAITSETAGPGPLAWRTAMAALLLSVLLSSGAVRAQAVVSAKPTPAVAAPAAAADPAVARGAGLYRTKGCVMCHGDDAKGGVKNRYSQSLTIPALERVAEGYTKDELREKIKKGVALVAKADPKGHVPILVMPSWEDKLAPEELDAIIEYLFSLAPKGAGGADDF